MGDRYIAWYCTPVTNNILHCILFSVLGRIWDVNLLKTLTNYGVGRLISTSSGLFKEWPITFIAWYCPPVTKISLHCLWFMVFGRLSDVNLIKTVTKYVVGRLIGVSSELFKEWAIAILRDIAPQWQKPSCMVYDSMFWGDLGMSIWLKLLQNM